MTNAALSAQVADAPAPAGARGGRIAALDGLRGAAALMVVLAHYFGEAPGGWAALTWGWIGVSVFFVLSGFLIGGIIIDQRDEPGFWGNFYLRRAARILPPYILALAVAFVGAWLFRSEPWVDPLRSPLVYLTFMQNIAIPLAADEGSPWLLPTWTLAVEEQFYLVLPALMVFAPRRLLAPTLVVLWASSTFFRLAIHETNPLGALTLLPSRMDLLLAGVLAALAIRRVDFGPRLAKLRVAPLIAVLALLPVALSHKAALFTVLNPLILSVGAATFILALALGAPEARRFEGRILGFLGMISYGLYLYHQPISGLLHGTILGAKPSLLTPAALGVTVLALAVSILAAYLSWRFVEAPVLAAARFARRRA